jgi:hypothetical protein
LTTNDENVDADDDLVTSEFATAGSNEHEGANE